MENSKTMILVILATLYIGTLQQQNFFEGLQVLQINPELILKANNAISSLKNTLYANFDCEEKRDFHSRQRQERNSHNLRGRYLKEEYQHHHFRGIRGDSDGFFSRQSQWRGNRGNPNYDIYTKVKIATESLAQIKKLIVQYNNIVIGSGNSVEGSGNVVIGSRNSLNGNNDWVFASDYQSTSPSNGVLIIQVYIIDLSNIFTITYNPTNAIQCIKQNDSNDHFKKVWGKSGKRFRKSF